MKNQCANTGHLPAFSLIFGYCFFLIVSRRIVGIYESPWVLFLGWRAGGFVRPVVRMLPLTGLDPV